MKDVSLSRKQTKVVVIEGRNYYLLEAEKQLSDKKRYQEVSNSENILSKFGRNE